MNKQLNSATGYLVRDRQSHPAAYDEAYKSSIKRSPQSPLITFPSTLSEETGPVFGHHIIGELDNNLIQNFSQDGHSAIGQRLIVYGRVTDQNGRAVSNCLIEVWQANAGGRYRHKNEGYIASLDPNFAGCGRMITDENGNYQFSTIMPGAYPWPNGPNSWRPAHIHFSLFGEAFAQRLITQMYFEGDPLIPLCPIISTIKDQNAIDALIAPLDMERTIPMDALAYRFDITLRGRNQTFFENKPEGM